MHVASVIIVRGRAARLRRRPRGASRSGCTSSRATARSSPGSRSTRVARSGSTTRTSTSATTSATRALPAPGSDEQLAALAGRLFAVAARPPQAALGGPPRRGPRPRARRHPALRADRQDPPRARRRRLRRRHHLGAVLDDARTRCRSARPSAPWVPAPGAELERSCSREALLERVSHPGRGRARRPRARARAAQGPATSSRHAPAAAGDDGLGRHGAARRARR